MSPTKYINMRPLFPPSDHVLRRSAYSHDIDPHSYDVDPLEEGMAFKEQSLFACKQAVVQLYKDITFSFSWTLHRE